MSRLKKASSCKEEASTTLSELFLKYGHSVESVSKIMGVAENFVNDWARGVETPDAMTCIKMARGIGCSLKVVYLALISTPLQDM